MWVGATEAGIVTLRREIRAVMGNRRIESMPAPTRAAALSGKIPAGLYSYFGDRDQQRQRRRGRETNGTRSSFASSYR